MKRPLYEKIIIGVIVMYCVLLICASILQGCSVNASKLDSDYAKEFAENVRCAYGYNDACWCFVASRKTGSTDSTGIGMTLAPDDFCVKRLGR